MRRRVAVGGFEQETNTFAPGRATWSDFDADGPFGSILRGPDLLATRTYNTAIAGFVNTAAGYGWDVRPAAHAEAMPGPIVARRDHEALRNHLIDRIVDCDNVDAVFLQLHGAMVAEGCDDPEADFVAQLRTELGRDLPIVASLDLHANVSDDLVELTDGLVSFRTFPHVDAAATGRRAAHLLAQIFERGRPSASVARPSFLIPSLAQSTIDGPSRTLYDHVDRIESQRPDIASLSFNMGFNAADTAFTGPSAIAYGWSDAAVADAAKTLVDLVEADAEGFRSTLSPPADAAAAAAAHDGSRPLLLADVTDNPGGGSGSDSMTLVAALLAAGASGVAVGLVHDREAAHIAHAAGVGATIDISLGGRVGSASRPLGGTFTVVALPLQPFRLDGAMGGGMETDLGPTAVLSIDGISIVVTSKRTQIFDLAHFRCAGIEPTQCRALVVKSTLHYRADFDPVVHSRIDVDGDGQFPMDPTHYPYQKLRPGVRRLS